MMISHIRSRSGMALLNVIMLVILVGGLVIAGYKMMGPIIQRGKVNDTKTIIKSDVDAIISWTVTNCRIPDAGTTNTPPTDFNHVVQNPNDAWGNALAYLYAPELANNSSCAQICGLNATKFLVNGITDSVAFLILSSQYSSEFHYNLPTSSPVTVSTGVIGTVSQVINPNPPDIARIVTLNELKARIGCAGYTWGQLRILNNELPNACSGASYTATIYPDGGAPSYSYVISGLPIGLTASGNTITGNAPTTTNTYPITVQITDSNAPAQSTQRTYNLKVVSCSAAPGTIPPGTTPDPPVQPPTPPGFDTSDPNLIEFGLDNNDTSACVWYPQNLPLLGKTMRAYWNFCYKANDTSATSSTYADGYTFALMQANNPTSYCGTGSTYNAVTNPRFDCSLMGGLGEYLAYCGLPGNSFAFEFDIYPSSGRNDPAGSYNHLAVIKSSSTHNAGAPVGLYGDNTHNVGGNPACTIASTGCLYDNKTGHTYPVTWLENTGCNATYDNHNARVELHTRCNSDCSQCETNSCTTKVLLKVWIDRSNSNLSSDDATTPDMSYCTDLPTALNQYKVGFTEATGGAHQWGYIKNFSLTSLGTCPLATISPSTLPTGTVGIPYSATMSASGGTPPYSSWSWSSTSIPGVTASNLPPGLSMSTAGVISGTPTAAGTYNTVLVSVKDSCTTDTCDNIVSKSYTITIATNPCTAFSGWSGALQNITNCVAYSDSTSVIGGTSPFTWSMTGGSLPSGFSFCSGSTSATCTITGTTLAAPGTTYNFTEQVSDSCSLGAQTSSQAVSISVAADGCYSGGMQLRNSTGSNNRWFSLTPGVCTQWNNGATIAVMPSNSIKVFTSNANCLSDSNECASTNYCDQKSYNTDTDCDTRMTGTCSFSNR